MSPPIRATRSVTRSSPVSQGNEDGQASGVGEPPHELGDEAASRPAGGRRVAAIVAARRDLRPYDATLQRSDDWAERTSGEVTP